MKGQAEPVSQQLLQHCAELIPIGHSRRVGLSCYVELVGFNPCGRAGDLPRMHGVGEVDEVRQCGVHGVQHAAIVDNERETLPVGIGRLNRGNLELRFGFWIHNPRRRRRLGNRPGCCWRGFRQYQRGGRSQIPITCDRKRVSIGAQLTVIITVRSGQGHPDRRAALCGRDVLGRPPALVNADAAMPPVVTPQSRCLSWCRGRQTEKSCRDASNRDCGARLAQDASGVAAGSGRALESGTSRPRTAPAGAVLEDSNTAPQYQRTFSMKSGSLDNLKVSLRCGCKAKARQMRLTVLRLSPACAASETCTPVRRVLRCRFQRHRQHALDIGIAHFAWRPRSWFIQQPLQPPLLQAAAAIFRPSGF